MLFNGLDNKTVDNILENLTHVALPKKSIIHYTATYKSIFLILKGRVKISKINPDNGREYTLSLLNKGDIFDVVSFLTHNKQELNIEAIDELQLLKTSLKIARVWLEENPIFNRNFLSYLGKRLKDIQNENSNLALFNTKTRLAKLILDNTNLHIEGEKYSIKLINDLSHDALAQMIGSVRKIVSLNIQELKKDKIITFSRGNLSILDMSKLKEICSSVT